MCVCVFCVFSPCTNAAVIAQLGKTKWLIKLLGRLFRVRPEARVIVLAGRRTYSFMMMKELSKLGFKSYLDLTGPLTQQHSRVLVQIDSATRLTPELSPWDVCVLDEVGLITTHACSRHSTQSDAALAPNNEPTAQWLDGRPWQGLCVMCSHLSEARCRSIVVADNDLCSAQIAAFGRARTSKRR